MLFEVGDACSEGLELFGSAQAGGVEDLGSEDVGQAFGEFGVLLAVPLQYPDSLPELRACQLWTAGDGHTGCP